MKVDILQDGNKTSPSMSSYASQRLYDLTLFSCAIGFLVSMSFIIPLSIITRFALYYKVIENRTDKNNGMRDGGKI